MSFLFPDPPTPPSPIATAGAQTASNVSTAVANAFLNNTNQVTPTGSLTYNPTSTYSFPDPLTGVSYDIPRFTATQNLSPNEQAIQTQSEGAKLNLAQLANTQSGRLGNLLSSSINLANAPATGNAGALSAVPQAATSFGGNTDYNAARAHVEDALFRRLQPQTSRELGNLEQRLADQGIRYGSSGYHSAMDDYNRQINDLRLGVTQAGAAEQQQAYLQDLGRGTFSNAGLAQQMAQAQAAFNAANTSRQNYLTEQYALRNQPINEVTALLSGSQVSRPSFTTTPTTTIANTDVAGLMNTNFAQQLSNYQQQSTNTNQIIGGLFGLGGNLLRSDRRIKQDIHRIGTVMAATPQPVQEPETKQLPIYEYRYKGDESGVRHVGPMAQDVEKVDPQAVRSIDGVKHISPAHVIGSIMRAA
jgi:hypothetical protein